MININKRLLAGVAGAAGMIAVLTVISRVMGFGRWLVQAWALGSSATANAYASANTIPNVLYEVVAGGALTGAIVPLLAAPIAKKLKNDVNQIASGLLTWTILVLTPVAILLAAFARPIAMLFPVSVGSDAQTQVDLATMFLIVFSPQVVLYGVGVVLTGILQAHKRFLAPVVVPIASTLVVVLSYFVFGVLAAGMQDSPSLLSDSSLAWLAWGTTAGVVALSLPLLIPVMHTGVTLRFRLRFPPGVGVRARTLAIAGVSTLLAQQVCVLAIVWISRAYGVDGTINVFQYGQAVYFLPYAVLVVPLATVFFPRIAELADTDRGQVFERTVEESTRVVLVAAFMAVASVAAVAPAVQRIFEIRNAMPGMALGLTWMAPGLVGLSLIFHGSRVLFATGHQRGAVIATAAGWLSVVLVTLIAVRIIDPGPVASSAEYQTSALVSLGIGHSVGMSLAAAGLMYCINRLITNATYRRQAQRQGLISAGAAIAGAYVGRIVVDLIMGTSEHIVISVGAAALGGLVAVAIVAGVAVGLDKSIITTLRRGHSVPEH